MSEPTCDWCSNPATHIGKYERRNTGTLVGYWCDEHYRPAYTAPPLSDEDAEHLRRLLFPKGRKP